MVMTWTCSLCSYRNVPDGKEHGIIFHLPNTAYCEAFLFELAINLSRQGCATQSTAYLREGFLELSGAHQYMRGAQRLRSITSLRSAVLLYIGLTIKGLPFGVTMCSQCSDESGSMSIMCFDGLQLGYRLKHKKPFHRVSVRCRPLPRASIYALLFQNGALRKALGSVMNVSGEPPLTSSKTVGTLTALRGYVMAVSIFSPVLEADEDAASTDEGGDVSIKDGKKSGGKGGKHGGKRGWSATRDGGANPALVAFIRQCFRGEHVARSLL